MRIKIGRQPFFRYLLRTLALLFITVCVACTKTEDHLRRQLSEHSDLTDPNSVMFRNIKYRDYLWKTWCGELNSKNRMGGYVGWMPFLVKQYDDGKVFTVILQEEALSLDRFDSLISKLNRDLYTTSCEETTAPASKWIPFWE